jgi:hypothetical protein
MLHIHTVIGKSIFLATRPIDLPEFMTGMWPIREMRMTRRHSSMRVSGPGASRNAQMVKVH